jgi:large subunit ribosomal protein L44e
MKLPKEVNRYCPYCKKQTKQRIEVAKQKSRSASHPMSRGSASREKSRGLRGGYGNKGRRSRKGPKDWKRKSKHTKRLSVLYTCSICKKSKGIKKAIRTSRLEIGEKVAK